MTSKRKIYGYAGKLLRLNLSTKKVVKEDLDLQLVNKFLGGQGLSASLLYYNVKPKIDPFSPENIVVIATGALTGTGVPSASRVEVTTKSPLTNTIGSGNFGGFWGKELKKAGYDAIVIENRAEKPLYLSIDDDNTELKDATDLWGKDCWDTTDILKKELGKDVKVLTIGQAGENLVRFACPIVEKYHAPGRCDAGGVMGSKNFKAIAVHGTKKIPIASPKLLREVKKEVIRRIEEYPKWEGRLKTGSLSKIEDAAEKGLVNVNNFQTGYLPEYSEALGWKVLKHFLKPNSQFCSDCTMGKYYGCNLLAEVLNGKYDGTKIGGASFSNTGYEFGAKMGILNAPAIFKLKEQCQRYGMDMSGPIPFAMELYQRRIICEKDTDGIKLEWGSEDAVLEMLEKIAYRNGFGDILAEGSVIAANKIGKGADKFVMTVKRKEIITGLDPRVIGPVSNLGVITSFRGGDNVKSVHAIYESTPSDFLETGMNEKSYMRWFYKRFDMFKSLKKDVFGSPPALRLKNDRSIVQLLKWYEDLTSLFNSLGICMFPINTWSVIGPTLCSKAYTACTGKVITSEEIMKYGERIFNLIKAYGMREGLTRNDDNWPSRFYEPLPNGPTKGVKLERSVIEERLNQYYKIRGWSIEKGVPKKDKLNELGLNDIAREGRFNN